MNEVEGLPVRLRRNGFRLRRDGYGGRVGGRGGGQEGTKIGFCDFCASGRLFRWFQFSHPPRLPAVKVRVKPVWRANLSANRMQILYNEWIT